MARIHFKHDGTWVASSTDIEQFADYVLKPGAVVEADLDEDGQPLDPNLRDALAAGIAEIEQEQE